MRGSAVTIALLLGCFAGACADDEFGVLLQAWPDGDGPLSAGAPLSISVRDLRTGRSSNQRQELDQAVPAGRPLRVAVELPTAGQVMVHLSVEDRGLTLGATRCFTVLGVSRSDLYLLDPSADDADGDGWPARDVCRDRGWTQGCANQCPEELADDCQDDNPDVSPGTPEQCADGADQNCDGLDAECTDNDGDGFPGCAVGAAALDCDCDDADRKIHPAVAESARAEDGLCENGIDDDCDGEDARCDRDHDGVPSCAGDNPRPDCDCNDDDDRVYPGATETPGGECDHIDNNCNNAVDEVRACLSDDLDGDGALFDCAGQGAGCVRDCNDCNAAMAPGRQPVCGNRIDEACELGGEDDGSLLPAGADACPAGDGDSDGYPGTGAGGTDCDDADPLTYPGAPDRCGGGSQDCSGGDTTCEDDRDSDGYNADNDCDDADAAVHPGSDEQCNAADDDCDGVVNEVDAPGMGCISLPAEGGGVAWQWVEFAADVLNCGRCRNDCNASCDGTLCRADRCEGGTCRCAGDPACSGAADDTCCRTGCRDTQTDVDNCGGCGIRCDAPVCQRAACRGGRCETVAAPDGELCGGGAVCCGGACVGACAPGSVGQRNCGDCGTDRRTCRADCSWGGWGGCQGEGTCTPLTSESRGCGDCGDQERRCSLACAWQSWGQCRNLGECAAGATEQQACGICGSQSRTCSGACSWGAWGACGGQGLCTPGDSENEPCGDCGTRSRTCSAACTWGAWGACGGEGECSAGAVDQGSCGNCGTRQRTCGQDCRWPAWGACGGEGECAAGTTDPRPCGNCGTQTRTCAAACTWGSWGSCNEGACSAGDTQVCGQCGTRTCAADCNWGACQGEGPCAPGATGNQNCPDGTPQTRSCQADCTWGSWAPSCP